jgi:DNA-binding MarR family transcriptional regulator
MIDRIKSETELSRDESRVAGESEEAVRCFRLIAYVAQRMRYLYDQRLREEGLSTQQGILLTIVRARGQPTLGEAARAMSTTHQNAKQIAAALERKGMLRIVGDETDGRVRRLEATESGARGWEDRNAGDFAAIAEWFGDLKKEEQEQLASLLSRLARTIS